MFSLLTKDSLCGCSFFSIGLFFLIQRLWNSLTGNTSDYTGKFQTRNSCPTFTENTPRKTRNTHAILRSSATLNPPSSMNSPSLRRRGDEGEPGGLLEHLPRPFGNQFPLSSPHVPLARHGETLATKMARRRGTRPDLRRIRSWTW